MISSVIVPIFVNLLSSYIYDKLKAKGDDFIYFEAIISRGNKVSKKVKYHGKVEDLDKVIDAIKKWMNKYQFAHKFLLSTGSENLRKINKIKKRVCNIKGLAIKKSDEKNSNEGWVLENILDIKKSYILMFNKLEFRVSEVKKTRKTLTASSYY